MRRVLLTKLVFILGFTQFAEARLDFSRDDKGKQIRVAVIDTGISSELLNNKEYCKTGHKDFTGTGLQDDHGHGTHISGIIDQYAKNAILIQDVNGSQLKDKSANYCQIIIKFYDSKASEISNLINTVKAIRWAIDQKVDIINYSGGGIAPSEDEKKAILEALNKGIKVVAAAGNEGAELVKHPFYPAMYDKRIYVVGYIVDSKSRKPGSMSNYGKSVTSWEVGQNIMSRLPNGQFGTMTGTSQATAVKSGKLVREMLMAK